MHCYGDTPTIVVPDSAPSTTTTTPRNPAAAQCYQKAFSAQPGQAPIMPSCASLDCWRDAVRRYVECIAASIGKQLHGVAVVAAMGDTPSGAGQT